MEVTVTKDNFETEIVKSELPVLADFWATWCGPCKMLAPVLEKAAEKYDGRIKICKINVDEESELAEAFSISSIPTLVAMKNGEIVRVEVGYKDYEELCAMLDDIIN